MLQQQQQPQPQAPELCRYESWAAGAAVHSSAQSPLSPGKGCRMAKIEGLLQTMHSRAEQQLAEAQQLQQQQQREQQAGVLLTPPWPAPLQLVEQQQQLELCDQQRQHDQQTQPQEGVVCHQPVKDGAIKQGSPVTELQRSSSGSGNQEADASVSPSSTGSHVRLQVRLPTNYPNYRQKYVSSSCSKSTCRCCMY
jgi:type II secretory pathway pseudopilin PulG